MKSLNLVVNSLKGNNLYIIFRKLFKKFEPKHSKEATLWAKSEAKFETSDFCKNIDATVFEEINHDVIELQDQANRQLQALNVNLGGSGNYLLLYFLTRKFKLENIVETGVAAGWTSLAILEALNKNGSGFLYSSDFPYFRLENPEKYVGFLVQKPHLKSRWHLDIRGDEISLPIISNLVSERKIDLFHYDSDKSYSGRKFALETLRKNFSPNCIIIFDDIQDNLHFKDWVNEEKLDYKVLEFQGKYVGVVGI